jgi:DASS family divalent anion:Na+ symporter
LPSTQTDNQLSPTPPIDWRFRIRGFAALIGVYLFVQFVVPKPAAVSEAGWRLTGIFLAAIVGSIIRPLPGGALVLIAVTLAAAFGGLTPKQALDGYADPSVWLVQAAFFISRALIGTGLARRIALFFVRLFGKSSLGVSYALTLSDVVLAPAIPANGARTGGVILPIVRSISELYGSSPGVTSSILGCFLFTAVYQGICVSAAMFFTGQASNPLAAQMAKQAGVNITVASWFLAGLLPGALSILVVPWIAMKLNPPEIIHTPQAAEFARQELVKMGPVSRSERIVGAVFLAVCILWIDGRIDVTVTALTGALTLILAGVLQWQDVLREEVGWDIFIWYGGMLRLGKALGETGVPTEFAKAVSSALGDATWPVLFSFALLVYFYAHYAFASITAHLLAMYVPFVTVLIAKGAPSGLVAYAFALFTNFAAGLTNYGTTPSPMFFAHGYVPLKTWWKVGFVCSLANLAIWSTFGFSWWKFLAIW